MGTILTFSPRYNHTYIRTYINIRLVDYGFMNEDLTWKFIIGVILLACSARSIMESRRSSPPLNLKTDECWYVRIVVFMTRMMVVIFIVRSRYLHLWASSSSDGGEGQSFDLLLFRWSSDARMRSLSASISSTTESRWCLANSKTLQKSSWQVLYSYYF